MNYELSKKYFATKPSKPNRPSLGLIIVLGIIGVIFLFAVTILGIILVVVDAVIAFFKFKNYKKALEKYEKELKSIPTDEEYDREVEKNLANIRERALKALGVDEDEVSEIPPISFGGYVFKGANDIKKGEDNLYRSDKYELVMLLFSAHEVHCYTYNFNTKIDKKTDKTDVYFYKDIVSVSTASDTIKVGDYSIDYEYFKLTTAGGTALSVSLHDMGSAQQSISAMRALLKEKKQA